MNAVPHAAKARGMTVEVTTAPSVTLPNPRDTARIVLVQKAHETRGLVQSVPVPIGLVRNHALSSVPKAELKDLAPSVLAAKDPEIFLPAIKDPRARVTSLRAVGLSARVVDVRVTKTLIATTIVPAPAMNLKAPVL